MTKGYDQRKNANARYLATQDEIKVRAPKGTKDRWKAAAADAGVSLQRFVIDAVNAAAGLTEEEWKEGAKDADH